MSSGEEEYGSRAAVGGVEDPKMKKRRIQRACDTCRRKKSDGATKGEASCSNCVASAVQCTYVEAGKKRGPPKGYVESLENRLRKMESLLQRLCPNADFTQELGVTMDRETWYNERQKNGNANPSPIPIIVKKSRPSSPGNDGAHFGSSLADDFGASDDDGTAPSKELKSMTVTSPDQRFHSKSSGLVLVQTAIDLKRERAGGVIGGDVSDPISGSPDFLTHPEWENKAARPPGEMVAFQFPPPDLLEDLISIYFTRNNPYIPVLHRPTFERQYREEGRHLTDNGFASVLLLVCAIASRSSDDPRVMREQGSLENESEPARQNSSGWKYFDQLKIERKSLITSATLTDLQQYALAGIFLQNAAASYPSWVIVGIGLRVAQDVGAHRKKTTDSPMTVEDELWKRAFWALVSADRLGSAALGRPCAIHDEDFDLDLPLEVDDEYWESPNPENAFKQPPDIPSTVAYFKTSIKLHRILSYALRTVYSINRSRILLGYVGKEWEQNTIADLDTMLNQWQESIPAHLRWESSREVRLFSQQTNILYATYYYFQIIVHRPFIAREGTQPHSFPSLTICTNAAKACSDVLDFQRRLGDPWVSSYLTFYAFTSALVLLLDLMGRRESNLKFNPMSGFYMCRKFLRAAEKRWHLAGRLFDILTDLASGGGFPLPSSPDAIKPKQGTDAAGPSAEQGYFAPLNPVAQQPSLDQPQAPTDMWLPMNSPELALQFQGLIDQQPQGVVLDTGAAMPQEMVPNVQWYPQQPAMAATATSMSTATKAGPSNPSFDPSVPQPMMDLLTNSAGQTHQTHPHHQVYPSSAPPFLTTFPHKQQQPQGPYQAADFVLTMWNGAPLGFEWEEWGTFNAPVAPVAGFRLDEEQHPS